MRPLNIEELKQKKNETWRQIMWLKYPVYDKQRRKVINQALDCHALDLAIENYPDIVMTDTGLSMTRREWERLNPKV